MTQSIIHKLAQLRRKQTLVISATGAFLAAAFLVIVLGVEMLADWGIAWPWSDESGLAWIVRAAILALIVAALSWIVLYRVVWPIILGSDDEALALAVERQEPDLKGRLIASVEFLHAGAAPAHTSRSLVVALIRQTEDMVRDRDFERVVQTDTLVRTGSICMLVVVAFLLAFLICLPSSAVLLRRALLGTESVPRRTSVLVVTGDLRVPKGESVVIIAQAQGARPSSGTLELTYPQARYTFTMPADPTTNGQFLRRIENVTSSFSYIVRLNDGRSDRYNVEAVDRPAVLSMQFQQTYPPYIHLPPTARLPGDLSLVAGSRLQISVKANKPLRPNASGQSQLNHVHLTGSEQDFPLKVDAADSTQATSADEAAQTGIPLPPGTAGLSIHLVDQDGFTTKNPTIFRIELLPDKPPFIRMTSAETRGELVTRVATEHITFDAYDDFALGRLALRYRINDGPQQEIPIPLNPPNPQALSGYVNFDLSKLPVPDGVATLEGSTIQYWLHAEDLNTISNPNHLPGACDTDAYSLKVVSEEEKRRELMNRAGAIPDQLNPITQQQLKDSELLGNLIIHGAATLPADSP